MVSKVDSAGYEKAAELFDMQAVLTDILDIADMVPKVTGGAVHFWIFEGNSGKNLDTMAFGRGTDKAFRDFVRTENKVEHKPFGYHNTGTGVECSCVAGAVDLDVVGHCVLGLTLVMGDLGLHDSDGPPYPRERPMAPQESLKSVAYPAEVVI